MTNTKTEDNFAKLDKILTFEQGWNGYDGLPFTPELVTRVKAVLQQISEEQQPGIYPTGRNSILMEWNSTDGHSLDAEIFESTVNIVYTANCTDIQGRFAGQYEGRNNISTEELLWSIEQFCETHNI